MSIRVHLLALGRERVLGASDEQLARDLGASVRTVQAARNGLGWRRPSPGRPRKPQPTIDAALEAVGAAIRGDAGPIAALGFGATARALDVSPQALRARIKSAAKKRVQNGESK